MKTFIADGAPRRGLKAAALTVYQDGDGTIYVHSAAADMSPAIALLCCSYDGTPVIERDGHVYVPMQFVRREQHDDAQLLALMDRIEAMVAKRNAEDPGP